PEKESQPHGLIRKLRGGLEFHVDVCFGPLLRTERAVGPGHAVVEQGHVVLDHAVPLWLGIPARSRGIFYALECGSLRNVGAGAVETRFLVVPESESDRSLCPHIGTVQHARQLHDQRRPRAVVIDGLAPAYSVHVGADDVHLVGSRRPDLRAIHLFSRAGGAWLGVELTKLRIGLRFGSVVHARRHRNAADSRASGAGADFPTGHGNGHAALRSPLRLWRVVLVLDAPGVTAEALQLAFDPVDRCAIAIRPLAPIAEFGQSLDRGLVPLQFEPSDQYPDRVVGRSTLAERGRAQHCDQPADCAGEYLGAHDLSFPKWSAKQPDIIASFACPYATPPVQRR